MMLTKQDPYCELKLGAYWKYKTSVKVSAGSSVSWDTDISQEVVASQLQQSPFEIIVKDKNSTQDAYLGRGEASGIAFLQMPNQWVTLAGNLKPCGKFRIEGQYVSSDKTNGRKSKRTEIRKQLGRDGSDIENAMNKQLRDELDKERKMMMAMMEDLKKKQSKTTTNPAPTQSWHGLSITELKKVMLPSKIYDWRAAHVQAWLAFNMDLPQYVQQFQDASIDGFLLLKHVDECILRDKLQIGEDLDVGKILGGIEQLKARQAVHDRAAAKKEAEEEAALADAIEKARQKKKKTKKGKPDPITFFGDVKEQNDLERVRLERLMKHKRAEDAKSKKKLATRSDVWKFEYTGTSKPVTTDEELYGATQTRSGNTPSYERLMAGLFRENTMTGDTSVPSYTGPVRQIPRDSVVDEVVAMTKAAMFELSNRLLAIEKKRAEAEKDADSDIDAFGEDVVDDIEVSANHDDESPVPDELSNDDGDDDEYDDIPPPAYDEDVRAQELASIPPMDILGDTKETIEGLDRKIALLDRDASRFDRSLLVFNALVYRQNNDASFLGKNDKLTRMKFHGGLEAVLRLKMSWPQFDALWTKLDYKRSGELDSEEFATFFGDFSEYDNQTAKRKNGSVDTLADIMYDFCNVLRRENFTVVEIFSSFDRNGSGDVSISEFCSMVRTVLGQHIDKKKVFRAFSLMDVDCNRCISCQEVLTLVYNVWKSQMKDLAAKLSELDPALDASIIHKIMDERNMIKEAVKRNFPREWRDRLERTKEQYTRGAFASLLTTMNISTATAYGGNGGTTSTMLLKSIGSDRGRMITGSSDSVLRSPSRQYESSARHKASASGKNEILRYKVNKSRAHIPTREGACLKTPRTISIGKGDITSEGATLRILQQTEPAGGKIFAVTSNI